MKLLNKFTAWKVSKYEVFSGPNTGKHGPEKTPYLDTFHAVIILLDVIKQLRSIPECLKRDDVTEHAINQLIHMLLRD